MSWKKFDSIENLKKCKDFKTLYGTVKLHGTNGSVLFNSEGFEVYSRTQKLSENNTNNGFYNFVIDNIDDFKDLRSKICGDEVIIYGEYAGTGINKGAAICYTPRKFYVFKILVDDIEVPLTFENYENIKNIKHYKTFTAQSLEEVDKFTNEVLKECPVTKQEFDISGNGEGIVWVDENGTRWKTKWDKPDNPPKVKTPKNSKDYSQFDESLKECLQIWRYEQFINDADTIPEFIKLIIEDCIKEVDFGKPFGELEKDQRKYLNSVITKASVKYFKENK